MPNRTPRILIVTRNLPPLVGGMERLNWHVSKELTRYAEVRVIGPMGSAVRAPELVKIDEVGTAKMASFLLRAFPRCLQIARQWQPDIILAGSGLTGPIAVIGARLVGARAVVYAHGLDLTVDHAVYRRVWLPLIARANAVVVNSSATRKLALAAGVREQCVHIVHPGVELPPEDTTEANRHDASEVRMRHGLGSGKLLISVGRLTRRKGILEFVREVLPTIVECFPRCMLVVVGDAPMHALAAPGQSVESIHAAAVESGVESNIRFVGKVSDDELAAFYRVADLHVFPVQEIPNDPEGFGMVAIEAAAYGVPTVAYRTGGVPDAVSELHSGSLVAPGDASGFASAAIALLNQPLPREGVRQFAQRFSWERIGRQMASELGLTPLPN